MPIQFKKVTSASVPNAIDSDHVIEFLDISDDITKVKDNLGNVTPKISGVTSVGGLGGVITASQIKTIYEGNADTNAFTDSEKTKLAGLGVGAVTAQTVSSNITHSGPNYTTAQDVATLSLTSLAAGLYLVNYTLICSQPTPSAGYKFVFTMKNNGVSSTKVNGTISGGTELALITENVPKQVTNFSDAGEKISININTVVEIVTAGSGITFDFAISANSVSFVPTIHKGSRVTFEAL